jgi:outer membrane protein assembly factor BamA
MFGGRFDGLASAFLEDELHPGFEVRRIGTSVRFSRQITRSTATAYRYTLEDVDTMGDSAEFDESTLRLSSVAVSALHDTRDALFDPRRGHFLGGELQYFGAGIGSEATFTRFSMQVYSFKSLTPRIVWAQALRGGIAVTFGPSRDDPASSGDPVSGVPESERFFAGGDTTVRGFERDRLGPIDPVTGDPTGGETFVVFNEELRFPIWRFVNGAVFYDAGNVYRTRGDFDLGDIRHVAGIGLRLATPIGPFRLEYGAILDREPGEEHGQFFFSIGQAF